MSFNRVWLDGCTRSLVVADFSSHDIREFLRDSRLEDLRKLLSVASILDLPVQPGDSALYMVTHLLSDAIRNMGFDAVAFRSSVGPGNNFVAFSEESLAQTEDSREVIEVQGLKYEFKPHRDRPPKNGFYETRQAEFDPLTTIFESMSRRT